MKSIQEHLLLIAINESTINRGTEYINHLEGSCTVNGIEYKLIFPISLISKCKAAWTIRSLDYFFKGMIPINRNWCKSYTTNAIVEASDRGRNPALKYNYDNNYYATLCKTKFGLCPVGECPWSYRFFESIMCGAIPVLGDDDVDIYADGFKYYRHSDEKVYHQSWAVENFEIMLREHTLSK